MSAALTRKSLFCRLRGGGVQLRPPWARSEEAFTAACTLCGKCIEACPARILKPGQAGYPIVDFSRGACTFCGACAEACKAGCFARDAHAPWRLEASIADACIEAKGIACRLCQDACEPRAIRFRPALGGRYTAHVDGAACTGCGACVAPCPVQAITLIEPEREAVA